MTNTNHYERTELKLEAVGNALGSTKDQITHVWPEYMGMTPQIKRMENTFQMRMVMLKRLNPALKQY